MKSTSIVKTQKAKLPTDFFSIMWDDQIWQSLVGEKNFTPKARATPYLDVPVMKRFFGQILMKGVIGLVSSDDFHKEELFSVEFEGKSQLLPRNVFSEISGNLIFDPKLIYDILLGNFQRHVIPGYYVTIDEVRIPSRHYQCDVKKYNPKKPDVWAIESKCLNDSSKYLLHFIYPLSESVPTPKESVLIFCEYLQSSTRRHHITMDSNFLSANDVPLCDSEGNVFGFECTISCKKNRPSEIWKPLQEELPHGYTRVVENESRICSCTKSNGFVNLASDLFEISDNKDLYKPEDRRTLLNVYDETKGYTDDFGHLVKAYYPDQTFKNYKLQLVVGWFMYACTNAWILYSLKVNEVSHRKFLQQIAAHLLDS